MLTKHNWREINPRTSAKPPSAFILKGFWLLKSPHEAFGDFMMLKGEKPWFSVLSIN